MRERRFGIMLTPFKASILDLITGAGDLGVSSDELWRELYRDHPKPPNKLTIKAHVWQINELLAGTDYRIISERRRWRVSQKHQRMRWQRRRIRKVVCGGRARKLLEPE